MSLAEVFKRLTEHLKIYIFLLKYQNPSHWPYSRFASNNILLKFHSLPGIAVKNNWKKFRIYNTEFNLTKQIDWYFSEKKNYGWPFFYYSKINYRAGNPYGDVRINWELSRLQFLPAMAVTDEDLAKDILKDWMTKNPYVHGPAYLASMEVALRWLSIYWAACLFKKPLEQSLLRNITGLAVASGKFIKSRLSTHSSAGNHLIVEAVGLFWLGKALEDTGVGNQWMDMARNILKAQVPRQISPDGSNKEQSFWYLGFVLDALFHYILLEDRTKVPSEVWNRVEKMLEFVDDMISSDGSFPDYGDRDDGFVFRIRGDYDESPFPGLLSIGAYFYDRPEWYRESRQSRERLGFWTEKEGQNFQFAESNEVQSEFSKQLETKLYDHGGMTLMKWGKGKLLFRHARLGLGNTYGHGHADALSMLFSWQDVPVLIDLGSGQYNGNQDIRSFFRSTIAHNTVEIGGKDQAKMLGPFMWRKSYETNLAGAGISPFFYAEANHDGYVRDFSIIHNRRIEWTSREQIVIYDSFSGSNGVAMRGAFHFGINCCNISYKENHIEANFGNFKVSLLFPHDIEIKSYFGSVRPFLGWRSTVYGKWEPIHSLIFHGNITKDYQCRIVLKIEE